MKLQPPTLKMRDATVAHWLGQGAQLHRSGNLTEAEVYYQAILKAQPSHFDAMQLLGLLRFQQGRAEDAAKHLKRALAMNPGVAAVHFNLGNVLASLKRYADAVASYDAALKLEPGNAEAHQNRGLMFMDLRRLVDAVTSFDKALAINPKSLEAAFGRANAMFGLQRLEEALAAYDRVIALAPNHPEALNNRGVVLKLLGRPDEALASYDQAIALAPGFVDAHNNRGNALIDLSRHDEALVSFAAALALKPDHADALSNRGNALRALKRFEEALASYRDAAALKPDDAEIQSNLGSALKQSGRLEDALACYDRALKLRPDHTDALTNRGNVLSELQRFDEALASYDRSLALRPGDPEAEFNRASLLLLQGDFAAGWPGYEARFTRKGADPRKLIADFPVWRGEDLRNKRLIVYEEQGLGDVLQFARYLPRLAAGGAEVTFLVRAGLHRLLRPLANAATLIDRHDGVPFDVQSALLSLPGAFGTTPATIPAEVPYLAAEPDLAAQWQDRLGLGGIRVGIVWQGNPSGAIDAGRSIPLRCFAPLAAIPDVRLLSLQRAHGLDQLDALPAGMHVETLGGDVDSGGDLFVDTAAIMASLDLVITSDTAIAHLAGSLGRPTWLALKRIPDWRWHLDRTDSPWYPTMRLYRQTMPGDWAGVFERMALDLSRLRETAG